MGDLLAELKVKIVETLDLVDLKPEDMGTDERLVGGDYGIDSIDVLELVIMIEQDYGVTIDTKELGEKVFRSVGALASYLEEQRLQRSE